MLGGLVGHRKPHSSHSKRVLSNSHPAPNKPPKHGSKSATIRGNGRRVRAIGQDGAKSLAQISARHSNLVEPQTAIVNSIEPKLRSIVTEDDSRKKLIRLLIS